MTELKIRPIVWEDSEATLDGIPAVGRGCFTNYHISPRLQSRGQKWVAVNVCGARHSRGGFKQWTSSDFATRNEAIKSAQDHFDTAIQSWLLGPAEDGNA